MKNKKRIIKEIEKIGIFNGTQIPSIDDLGFVFNRIWAMPNKWTFKIHPIKNLLTKYGAGKDGKWADPFCGILSPANVTNDINPEIRATYNTDALDFLKNLEDGYFTGILYDPPYSITQARTYGKKEFASMKYWADCKNEIARAIKPGGYAICFGWNSNGMGKNRGFFLKEILLVAHGGSKNDTICTVEEKLPTNKLTPMKKENKNTKEISNLVCPKCGHKITNKDLKYWRCTNCGKSFKERTNL